MSIQEIGIIIDVTAFEGEVERLRSIKLWLRETKLKLIPKKCHSTSLKASYLPQSSSGKDQDFSLALLLLLLPYTI